MTSSEIRQQLAEIMVAYGPNWDNNDFTPGNVAGKLMPILAGLDLIPRQDVENTLGWVADNCRGRSAEDAIEQSQSIVSGLPNPFSRFNKTEEEQ